MFAYKTDPDSIQKYLDQLHDMIGEVLFQKNNPDLFPGNRKIIYLINQICECLDLEMRFVARKGDFYVRSTCITEEVAYFPVIYIIFDEVYAEVMECPDNTSIILKSIRTALKQQEDLLESLKK